MVHGWQVTSWAARTWLALFFQPSSLVWWTTPKFVNKLIILFFTLKDAEGFNLPTGSTCLPLTPCLNVIDGLLIWDAKMFFFSFFSVFSCRHIYNTLPHLCRTTVASQSLTGHKVNFTLQQVINACPGSNIIGRRPACKTLWDKLEILGNMSKINVASRYRMNRAV